MNDRDLSSRWNMVTGELVWFNQAHLFHVSSLEPKTRTALLSIYSEEELPRNAYYGD